MTAQIPIERFKLNYEMFELCVDRPDVFRKREKVKHRDNKILHMKYGRLITAHDNVYHIRSLLNLLFTEHLIIGSVDKPDLVDILRLNVDTRRMWALLAVMYGCVREPAIWLTVMDALLENLARTVRGHVDHAYETVTMFRTDQILSYTTSLNRNTLPSQCSEAFLKRLRRENFARNVFAEMARFFRGAVLLTFAEASVSRSPSKRGDPEFKQWYDELIKWHGQCGHPNCYEQLETNYNPDALTQQWSLSVGVVDARVGTREIRYASFSAPHMAALTSFAAPQSPAIVRAPTRVCTRSSSAVGSIPATALSSTTLLISGIYRASLREARIPSLRTLLRFQSCKPTFTTELPPHTASILTSLMSLEPITEPLERL